MHGKTLDGLRLSDILRAVKSLPNLSIREGTRHPYLLYSPGLHPCPVASSTHARRMLVPWLKQATGYESEPLYQALRQGSW